MSIRFASSRHNDMRPLAFQGVFATNCYEQLHALLERNAAFLAKHGMPDAGLFLAEPMHDSRGGCIDWYTEAAEEPVRLTDLPADKQAAVKETLARSAAALQALFNARGWATQGQLAPSDKDPMAVGLLKLAFQHPSPDDIYVAGDRPILTNWGFRQGSGNAAPEDILRQGAASAPMTPVAPEPAQVPPTTPPTPPVAAATPAKRNGCLVWLLPLPFLLLLLFIIATLLDKLPAGCSRDTTVALPAADEATKREEMRKSDLADEYTRVLGDLSNRAAECRPETVPEEKSAEQEPVIPDLDTPAKSRDMEIPEDAAKTNDLSFLDGCWESDDLFESLTGNRIHIEYCFDKQGQGYRTIDESNGQRCSGNVTARFQGNKLAMESSMARCPNGGGFSAQEVECTGSGNTTHCYGKEQSGKGTRWDARFTRK